MSGRHKIMLLGEIGVGKTSLVKRLVHDTFDGTYSSTFGFDIYSYSFAAPHAVDLLIWDTDGSVGAGVVSSDLYMAGTAGALVVCDLMRADSHSAAVQLAGEFATRQPGRDVTLVINKCDLANAPEVPPILHAAGYPVILTSAKTGQQVVAAFSSLAQAILRRGW